MGKAKSALLSGPALGLLVVGLLAWAVTMTILYSQKASDEKQTQETQWKIRYPAKVEISFGETVSIKPLEAPCTKNVVYSSTPALPNGLYLVSESGEIRGVPSKTMALKEYRITATGNDIASATMYIGVSDIMPQLSYNDLYGNDVFMKVGKAFEYLPATHTWDKTGATPDVLTFTVSPAFNPELKINFDSRTGRISSDGVGNVSGKHKYEIRAINSSGKDTKLTSFELTVSAVTGNAALITLDQELIKTVAGSNTRYIDMSPGEVADVKMTVMNAHRIVSLKITDGSNTEKVLTDTIVSPLSDDSQKLRIVIPDTEEYWKEPQTLKVLLKMIGDDEAEKDTSFEIRIIPKIVTCSYDEIQDGVVTVEQLKPFKTSTPILSKEKSTVSYEVGASWDGSGTYTSDTSDTKISIDELGHITIIAPDNAIDMKGKAKVTVTNAKGSSHLYFDIYVLDNRLAFVDLLCATIKDNSTYQYIIDAVPGGGYTIDKLNVLRQNAMEKNSTTFSLEKPYHMNEYFKMKKAIMDKGAQPVASAMSYSSISIMNESHRPLLEYLGTKELEKGKEKVFSPSIQLHRLRPFSYSFHKFVNASGNAKINPATGIVTVRSDYAGVFDFRVVAKYGSFVIEGTNTSVVVK